MLYQKLFCFFIICFILISQNIFSQIVVQGVVTDNGAEYLGNGSELVPNALVSFTRQSTGHIFSGYTNSQGVYSIHISSTGIDDNNNNEPGHFKLLQNYPNPFNPSTVIGYELTKPANITIEIYNVLGQKIKTLLEGYQTVLSGQVIWNASTDIRHGVTAGIYIYSLKAGNVRINKKMLLIDGQQGSVNLAMSPLINTDAFSRTAGKEQMSDQYYVQVTADNFETYTQYNLEIKDNAVENFVINRTVTDIDGNVYRTVKIGDQWWLAENLKVTHYRNGEDIQIVTIDSVWANQTTGAYCAYDNDSSNADTYGYFYNWFAVDDSSNIAPTGWHMPTDEEWKELEIFLGLSQIDADADGWRGTDEGGKLKESATAHWISPNTGATNESGFFALPGGLRTHVGIFTIQGYMAHFWSATKKSSPNYAFSRSLYYEYSSISRYGNSKFCGFSIRLVRDN